MDLSYPVAWDIWACFGGAWLDYPGCCCKAQKPFWHIQTVTDRQCHTIDKGSGNQEAIVWEVGRPKRPSAGGG